MGTGGARALQDALRAALARVADPSRAPAMQAYMKSAMPYLGVPATPLRQVCREVFRSADLTTRARWNSAVLTIWRGARFREERYAAIELTGVREARPYQTPEALPLYEELIVSGAWWDLVDSVASRRVGPILKAFPDVMKPVMRTWSRSDALWKRRASILCQLSWKQEMDRDLLYACIEPSLDSREFFLQKAIGWALRQYAWTDPAEVRRYVKAQGNRLSALSRREAMKNIL